MPWRLVGLFIVLLVYALFALFNLDNRTDVSVLVYTFEQVPIFVTTLIAFVAGGLVVLPFTVGRRWWRRLARKRQEKLDQRRRKKDKKQRKQDAAAEDQLAEPTDDAPATQPVGSPKGAD